MDERILRSLQGRASEFEEKQLAQWRADSPLNEQEYREATELWELTGATPSVATRPRPAVQDILEAAESRTKSPLRRIGWKTPAIITGLLAAAAAGLALWGGPTETTTIAELPSPVEYVAGPVEPLTVALEDGSVVRLAPGASVRFMASPDRREIELNGRAFFAVSHTGQDFVVHQGDGQVEVLGTRFEVAEVTGELRVVVVEGRVRASRGGASLEATANQVAHLPSSGAARLEAVEDALSLLEWPEGLLIFRDTPLSDVAEEVAGRFDLPVAIADTTLGQRRVTAWFEDEGFGEVVDALCLIVAARCEVDDDGARIGR